jgi:hypothetical protein
LFKLFKESVGELLADGKVVDDPLPVICAASPERKLLLEMEINGAIEKLLVPDQPGKM